ncbi:guanylate kinase [Chlorogloea sp. CCALA 695]|uniref:guanylate kinase n=1 Tax=Chlorogloea sp. CCALA 695 TaxID=2107693 RepID=UPI000D063F78|nr:guanylate kinase [Chlorogloea sp. CCALA 695]PSB34098.1 guanylate kinase [Chlorogloea sp. CCALA 695]
MQVSNSTSQANEHKFRGKLIVLTGPSGVGKGTLVQILLQRHPEIYLSISATTRSPRPGETSGEHYYFVSRTDFEKMISDHYLLEWAEFAGNYYGTPRLPVEQQIAEGKTVLLEVELDGANQIYTSCPDALRIFILPPSFSALEQRLRDRATDSSSAISSRLKRAQIEIASAGDFDVQITNDDLETALHQLESVILP